MNPKQQELVEKLKSANNILVTVSSNPSVDQLAACIGLTLLLNKLKKHATAVFSGNVPSTLEFLKPEETLEKNTDSLRDFIISLDKSKADKLRYKVEENVVKIFITPYKTSIGEPDLNFSQGDFNVDVVLCLGISQQQDLDQAITANGRILHDAVVASINTVTGGELGTINWTDTNASSLSELAVELADKLGSDLIDGQISTALLTGIVAETARFSNEKTSPNTMKISAELMSAGANQQLVATELQAPETPVSPAVVDNSPEVTKTTKDGTLEIGHVETPEPSSPDVQPPGQPKPEYENSLPQATEVPIPTPPIDAPTTEPDHLPASRMMLQPPSMGGALTANSVPESFDPSIDPLTMMNTDKPMLNHYQEHDAVTLPQQDKTIQPPRHEPTVLPAPAALADKILEEAVIPDTTPLMLPDVAPLEPQEVQEQPESSKPEPVFEPLPSEPAESKQPEDPKIPDDQIQIDTQGNLIMPKPPVDPVDEASAEAPILAELEEAVNSPHIEAAEVKDDPQTPDADAARDALSAIYSSDPNTPPIPKADVGASGYLRVQDLPDVATSDAYDDEQPSYMPQKGLFGNEPAPNASSPADQPLNMPLPPSLTLPPADTTPPTSTKSGPSSPPPVPPPFNPLP